MVPHSLLYAKYTFLTFESCMFHNVLCLVFGAGQQGMRERVSRGAVWILLEGARQGKLRTAQFFPKQEGNISDWHSVKRNENKTIKIEREPVLGCIFLHWLHMNEEFFQLNHNLEF